MTVNELITLLDLMPADALVEIDTDTFSGTPHVQNVTLDEQRDRVVLSA